MSEFLKNRSLSEDTLSQLFPDGLQYKDSNLSSPLVVQATCFDCGGMAIAICISHSIMDMSGICCFVNNWASLASKSCVPEEMTRPEFNFQHHIQQIFTLLHSSYLPMSLEVVQALLFKCAVSAAARARSSSGLIKPATLNQPVNMRTRVRPPLPESAAGNFTGGFSVSVSREEISKLDWIRFADKIRSEKCIYLNELAKNCRGEELITFLLKCMELVSNEDKDMYFCSNWCRFPLYDADFGWGKPTWVTPARYEFASSMISVIQMLDKQGGDGIEVLMVLDEQHMILFETDQELLAYATVS